MYQGRHARGHHHWLGALSAAAAILAVVVAVGLVNADQSGTGTSDTAGRASSSTPRQEARAVLAQCGAMWRDQTPVLRAAQRAIAQWDVHVGAMNQLVAGKITLAQATQFWGRTRVGAARRVADFQAADTRYLDRAARCETGGLPPSVRHTAALPSCARAVARREDVLLTARTTIGTWHRHITNMEMLRMGQLSPTQATRMWLKMWRRGVAEIDRYHAALARTQDSGSCPSG